MALLRLFVASLVCQVGAKGYLSSELINPPVTSVWVGANTPHHCLTVQSSVHQAFEGCFGSENLFLSATFGNKCLLDLGLGLRPR